MRVALLGAAAGFETEFEELCLSRLQSLEVERIAYLAGDGVLADLVQRYGCAEEGPDIWQRTRLATAASGAELGGIVAVERLRLKLARIERPPAPDLPPWRLGPELHLALCQRRPAREWYTDTTNVVVFGDSPEPVMQEADGRLYLSPGTMSSGGVLVVECAQNREVEATVYDVNLRRVAGQTWHVPNPR